MNQLSFLSSTLAIILACDQTGLAQVPSRRAGGDAESSNRVMLDEQVLASWQPEGASGLFGPKIELKSMNTSNWTVKHGNSAVAKAERILGIKPGLYPATAQLIAVLDDDTPFLTQFLLERAMWQIVIRDWTLTLPSGSSESRDPYVRTFDVLVRPEDGRVLKVKSRWPKEEPSMPPEPRADSATCQIYASNYTVYHDFPDSDPAVSFLAALDSAQKRGLEIVTAKQISARYVVFSDMRHERRRPVWAITARGAYPVLPVPGMAIERKYEYRVIVDAETGKFLCAGNRPLPDEVIENKPSRQGQ